VSSVANFDPTGVIGLVSLFLHDQCKKLPENIKEFRDSVPEKIKIYSTIEGKSCGLAWSYLWGHYKKV